MRVALLVLLVVAVAGGALAYKHERDNRREDVARLETQLRAVENQLTGARRQDTDLARKIRGVNRRALKARLARTTLAARVKRSVFTLSVSLDEGTAFVAWVKGRNSYLLTANHVVVLSVARGERKARVHQGRKVWEGKVFRTDPDHDIAVIRVPHRIAPPLWQKPAYTPPLVGDELLLVGSPLGYEGSVTSGVVGRVAFNEIQTDAAAYPGISGGPAVDAQGAVVGVLSSGEAENLNFAVPINLACRHLRVCPRQGR
jgi:S1-C subfamily serine protease